MHSEAMADVEEVRRRRLDDCKTASRKLIAEAQGGIQDRVEDVLCVDGTRLLRVAMDLIDALGRLRSAHDTYETLRRRDV